MKRLAGEEQASIYMRRGWTWHQPAASTRSAPKDQRLIDPAAIQPRPQHLCPPCRCFARRHVLAYHVRQGGADESTVRVSTASRPASRSKMNFPLASTTPYPLRPTAKASTTRAPTSKGTLLYLARTRNTRNFARQTHLWTRISRRTARPDRSLPGRCHRRRPLSRHHHRARRARQARGYRLSRSHQAESPFEVLIWGLDSRFSTIYARAHGT